MGDVVENGLVRSSRDVPERLDALLLAAQRAGCHVVDAYDHGFDPLSAVHSPDYLEFLSTAFTQWTAAGLPGQVVPSAFATRCEACRTDWSIVANAGYHLRDQITPLGEGTWRAAYWAAQTAVTAADLVTKGERRVYALCRPSGHHAGQDYGGGATYLNNAAIAARRLAGGGRRVSVVDFDVHHGNGTQDIFWDDPVVLFASTHRSPTDYYPHFSGFRDETGGVHAAGLTVNWPLARGVGDSGFLEGVRICLSAALKHDPVAVVVSLGFDALETDPAKGLLVSGAAFKEVGMMLSRLPVPVVLVQEGGYDLQRLEEVAAGLFAGLFSGTSERGAR
ncbi:histone deacetylase family protein [Rhizobium sp. SAFR-030]|uniref:histone deacetylase family protein n=1 Tax=Rhizobium sp. SAFR-030 TaxID=3387277 RepID=UPI003F7EFF36